MQEARQYRSQNATAIVGLVCVFVPVPLLSGIAAVVLGVVGLRQIETRLEKGRLTAILAIALGAVNLVGWGLPIVLLGLGTLITNLTGTNLVF